MSEALRRLTLGVIGHVDHGKTALVRALTGMETDRLPEEQRRGVSIVLGFAHARFEDAEVDFIDMPGHERFVRAMVSGATGVGAALLVVAANEGVKPQTVEHLDIAGLLGVQRVIPVIAKADLASEAQAATVAQAVVAQAVGSGLVCEPVQRVSTVTGQGLAALGEAIARLARDPPALSDDGFPWLPVDRAFTVAGRGTVVTGTLRRGRLCEADALALSPRETPVRVRGLQVHGRPVTHADPGQRVAVNLRGTEAGQAPRGVALAPPGLLTPARWLSVEVRATPSAPPLRTGARFGLLFGSQEEAVRLRLLDRDVLEPGQTALAQLDAGEPVAVPARERFVLRLPSPARTVGGGMIVDPEAGRLRRYDTGVLDRLGDLARASADEVIALTLADAGARGITPTRLARLAGLAPDRVETRIADFRAVRLTGGVWVGRADLQALANDILALLQAGAETQPNGLARRRLEALLPQATPAALEAGLTALTAAGRLSVQGGSVRLASRVTDDGARLRSEAALAEALLARLRACGLSPPDLDDLAPTPPARRVLEQLLKAGQAVRTFDRVQKRELVFHADALADARARLQPRLVPPGLTVGEAGAVLGVTRKFSVPLLEYLDTVRFTRRVGERRVLGPAAADW